MERRFRILRVLEMAICKSLYLRADGMEFDGVIRGYLLRFWILDRDKLCSNSAAWM